MTEYNPGIYAAKIVSQQLGKAKTGTLQAVIGIAPIAKADQSLPETDPNYWQDIEGGEARSRTIFIPLTAKCAQFSKEKLEKLGITGITDLGQIDQSHPQCVDVTDTTVMVQMRMDSYQGKERERWDVPSGGSGGIEVTPPDRNDLMRANAELGAAFFGGSSAPAAKPSPLAGVTETAADLPFA